MAPPMVHRSSRTSSPPPPQLASIDPHTPHPWLLSEYATAARLIPSHVVTVTDADLESMAEEAGPGAWVVYEQLDDRHAALSRLDRVDLPDGTVYRRLPDVAGRFDVNSQLRKGASL